MGLFCCMGMFKNTGTVEDTLKAHVHAFRGAFRPLPSCNGAGKQGIPINGI